MNAVDLRARRRARPGRPGHPRVAADPRLLAVGGSLCIAFSPILIALSGASPGTATVFRCVLALPVLVPLALLERRRRRRRAAREQADGTGPGVVGTGRPGVVLVGGALLGLDMTLWTASIRAVGAGVSTVLVNVQVVLLPLLAFLVLGERVRRGFLALVPVMLVGIALAGGLADAGGGTAAEPVLGTVTALLAAAAYAGYLLLIRLGAAPGERFVPVGLATAAAAASSFAVGWWWQGVDLTPPAATLAWLALLALVGQVVGWVLIASALPRLSSSAGASILLLQPVGAVLLGVVVLGEAPSALQLLGCAVVVGSVALAARARGPRPGTSPAAPDPGDRAGG